MARELRSALDGDQFYLLYQEQRCAKTEKVVGYEALLRWDHPERGAVPPGHFMPIAEESGAILPIGAWALRKACQQAVASNVEEKIAVNVSPMQLADAELANTVLEALVGTGLSPQRLEIEVTESAIIKDKRRALKTLRELRSKGVSIAVDDFGTGYSSLDKLRSFPFDRLKIDQSFVAGLERNAPLRAILGAILELGKSLHMETIAEGVETREQAKILVEAGCDALQGYLYAEPAPFASLRSATVASPS
jgi:EAL domain-containing protein (putative c-di-GMP-specific phosphodiesterase class I)